MVKVRVRVRVTMGRDVHGATNLDSDPGGEFLGLGVMVKA